MYAVIKTGGKQYKVSEGDVLRVEKLPENIDEEVKIADVLFVGDQNNFQLGDPTVKNATVTARILDHGLGKKVTVMKKKRRKGYKVKRGHRQPYTSLEIKEIKV
jgi:large subunit ribosomal protein L21